MTIILTKKPGTGGGGSGGGIVTETDPVAVPRLNTHKASADHDARYTPASHPTATDPHGDRDYADTRIAALVNGSPAALDTLAEIDAQLQADETGAAAMQAAINQRALATDLTAHISDPDAAHAASAVSVNPSGLIVVTGTTVQAALAQLDAAVVDNQTIELGYIANESGTVQVVNTTSDNVDGLALTLVQSTRPIYLTARVIVDVTAAPTSSNSGVANLLIVDGANNPLEQALFPVEGSSGTNGYLTCRVECRIAPNTPGQTYRVQVNRTGSSSFGGTIMHGSVSPIFRSWFKAEKR